MTTVVERIVAESRVVLQRIDIDEEFGPLSSCEISYLDT
jgi:hypothetical protein